MSTCRCEGDGLARRFAIIGHRTPSSGKINLNDLAGGSGRIDVLLRAINAALFLSHGIRKDSEITLHLMGGEGRPRRIKFDGSVLWGAHPDERALAGQVSKVIQEPLPAIGQWLELHSGLSHSGGSLQTTIDEWKKSEVTMIKLDSDAPMLWGDNNESIPLDIGFFLSDDRSFTDSESTILEEICISRSLGENWIQGHIAIGIVHHQLDNGFPLNL